ncbi:MAG: hypothetical protein AB3N14_09085 [Flavobacteriaceae bacterium]
MLRITWVLALVSFLGVGPTEAHGQPANQEWVQLQFPVHLSQNCNFRAYINKVELSLFWETTTKHFGEMLLAFKNKELTTFKSQNDLNLFRDIALETKFINGIRLCQTDDFYHSRRG